jgi:hypothetical protein
VRSEDSSDGANPGAQDPTSSGAAPAATTESADKACEELCLACGELADDGCRAACSEIKHDADAAGCGQALEQYLHCIGKKADYGCVPLACPIETNAFTVCSLHYCERNAYAALCSR